MRKVQHGLLQQRPGDESPGQRVSHGVFSVLGVQPAPPARGRVLSAGRRAAVSGRPRLAGGAGLRREPAEPREHPHQTAAHLRWDTHKYQHCYWHFARCICVIIFRLRLTSTEY